MTDQAVREALLEQLARIGKAVSSPRRVELLEILAQGERSVESLAEATGMSVANTSSHLQVLGRTRMVRTRRQGTRVLYSIAGERVETFVHELWTLTRERLSEVDRLLRQGRRDGEALATVGREELLARSLRGDVEILDVRPVEEYAAGHVPGAASVPLDDLADRLAGLPAEKDVVVYCRGPYCLLASEAAQVLRRNGFRVAVFEDGLPGWRRAGLPVSTGM